jgi:aminopeptidase
MDPRYHQLAQNLIGFSVSLQKGEKVLIDAHNTPPDMVIALIRAARQKGGIPFVNLQDSTIGREFIRNGTKEQFEALSAWELERMQGMQAYVAIRGANNIFEHSDVSSEQMGLYSNILRPVLDYRVKKTKWVVLRWPTPSMAQQALMSTEAFEDFYFDVCNMDYSLLIPGSQSLKERLLKTDQVHIQGPGTDLKFSIKGINAIPCGGRRNIPDGEVFTCPVRDSVQGQITYNTPTVYQGNSFDNVCLKFKDGKVVEATSSNTQRLNEILDQDEGARYIGEFAIGFNPYIKEPMRDILFDEKIAGSFHFTPGQAYEEADNGNRSQVHWDLVCIQRKEYGGGTIHFDGELIREDGLFVPEDLQALNPENLLAAKGSGDSAGGKPGSSW